MNKYKKNIQEQILAYKHKEYIISMCREKQDSKNKLNKKRRCRE